LGWIRHPLPDFDKTKRQTPTAIWQIREKRFSVLLKRQRFGGNETMKEYLENAGINVK